MIAMHWQSAGFEQTIPVAHKGITQGHAKQGATLTLLCRILYAAWQTPCVLDK